MARYRVQMKVNDTWIIIREIDTSRSKDRNNFDRYILEKVEGKAELDFPIYVDYGNHSKECCYRVYKI